MAAGLYLWAETRDTGEEKGAVWNDRVSRSEEPWWLLVSVPCHRCWCRLPALHGSGRALGGWAAGHF